MARQQRRESRVSLAVAGVSSVVLHVGVILLILFSGGQQGSVEDPGTPITQVVLLEVRADHRDGMKVTRPASAGLAATVRVHMNPPVISTPSLRLPAVDTGDAVDEPPAGAIIETGDAAANVPPIAIAVPNPTHSVLPVPVEPPSTAVMSQAQASTLLRRIEKIAAKKLTSALRAEGEWNQAGTQFHAELVLEPSRNSIETDRVIAHVKADDGASRYETRILLRRLSFSRFTQIVDFWDPRVQLHDDEVVGRMHINSRFNVLYDSEARPALLGKVSTAAGSYNMRATGRARESDVFREGIETRAERITLSERVKPLDFASGDMRARVHELTDDTRIRFFDDGSYWWRESKSTAFQRHEPSGEPVYFIATRGVTLFVQGVIRGQVVVYSPQKIVVEGSLTYVHDPREVPDSDDYLGLVCDKDIELASPSVTGPGDVIIEAALFAKRRFVITHFNHPRPATLRIYGSLATGMMTASEPRYATRIEFDPRYERLRPPGFPSMNRFAVEEWDRLWTAVPF